MSCDWSSYKIRSIQEAADDAKENSAQALGEVRRLKAQFDQIQRDHERILRNQEQILAALGKLSSAVEAMHEEMYPRAETTKPALKAPGAGG
jgi:hypothetical protein